jgi:putative tryptophan/tyrosine transport system substrate-binding protein
MRRREFITLVGGAVAAWPLAALGKAQRIAIVAPAIPVSKMTETGGYPLFSELFNELRRLGYVEGQSLLIERYSGEGRAAHFRDLAQDVVSRNPDVIFAFTNDLVLDFKATTTTIPIVGLMGSPVETGIVASLAHPGGNITGVAVNIGDEQWDKRIQLLRQVVPHLIKLAVLNTRRLRDQWEALMPYYSRRWAVTLVGPTLNHPVNEDEYRRVFAAIAQDGAEGIVVAQEDEHFPNHKVIVELAEKTRLPTIYPYKLFVEAGGLMSYGTDTSAYGRNIADIVGQILRGTKPSEIPIRQPAKFELAINLKTAKALDLAVPPELLATADEVIE